MRILGDGTLEYANDAAAPLLGMMDAEIGDRVNLVWRKHAEAALKHGSTGLA